MDLEKSKPAMQIDFNGPEGNIYFILAKAAELLKQSFIPDQTKRIDKMKNRVIQSQSYSEALQIIEEYVNIYPIKNSSTDSFK